MSKTTVDFFNSARSFYCILKAGVNTTLQKHGKIASSTFKHHQVVRVIQVQFFEIPGIDPRARCCCLYEKLYKLPCQGLKLGTHPFLEPINIKNMENQESIQSHTRTEVLPIHKKMYESSLSSRLRGSHSFSSLIHFPSNFNIILRIYIIQFTVTVYASG